MPTDVELQNRRSSSRGAAHLENELHSTGHATLRPPVYNNNNNNSSQTSSSNTSTHPLVSFMSNNAVGETISHAGQGGFGNAASRIARSTTGRFNQTQSVMNRIANGTANTVESARRQHLLETGVNARMGLSGAASRVSRYLPLLGLYSDSRGLRESVTGTGEAANQSSTERAYNGLTSGAGLVSSSIGTAALAGEGLTALGGVIGSGSVGAGLTSTGAGLTGLVGAGTSAGAVGAAAGAAGGVLAAGALGWEAGRALDRRMGISNSLSNAAYRNFGPTEDNYRNHWAYNLELPSWIMQIGD